MAPSRAASSEERVAAVSGKEGVTTGGGVFDVQALVRPNIWALQPYRCARDDYSTGVLLDANENAFGPCVPPQAGRPAGLERYPDPLNMPLKERIAAFRGVAATNIFLGVGSDEAVDLTLRIFCQPGRDRVLITSPTYPMYKVAAHTNDVGVTDVPLNDDFQLRTDQVRCAGPGFARDGSWLTVRAFAHTYANDRIRARDRSSLRSTPIR